MFGWVEFRKDGKYRKENRVENWVFLRLGIERKSEGWKTREKIFSPGPTNFFLPNWEDKPWEKTSSLHFYHNALSRHLQQLSAVEYNHPTTKPSTTTRHRNLAQKINPKLTEKQLENPIQNQDKPTGKPRTKSIKTHRETQLKIITDTPQNHQNRSKSRSKFIKPIYKFI